MIITLIKFALIVSPPQQPGGGEFLPTWQVPSPNDDGATVELPDVDGDGVSDFIHADQLVTDVFNQQGAIRARSGASGLLLWEMLGTERLSRLGASPPKVADLDGDGRYEVVAFNYPTTYSKHLTVMDAESGALKWQYSRSLDYDRFAWEVWVEDLAGDGTFEILALNRAAYNQPIDDQLLCFQADGSLAWEFALPTVSVELHFIDLNGDGIREVVIGLPSVKVQTLEDAGQLTVLDSQTGQVLWQALGTHAEQRLGMDLQFADLTGTGNSDIVAPCPQTMVGGHIGTGSVWAFQGYNGNLLWRLRGTESGNVFGEELVIGDIDGTPGDDVVLGLPKYQSEAGAVLAIRGADGQQLWQSTNPNPGTLGYGYRLNLKDITGDGHSDLLVETSHSTGLHLPAHHFEFRLLNPQDGSTYWWHATDSHFAQRPNLLLPDLFRDGRSQLVLYDSTWAPDLPGELSHGLVHVIQSDGTTIFRREGTKNAQGIGDQVRVGDLNGDGVDDLLIRAFEPDHTVAVGYGMLEAWDPTTASVMWQLIGGHARAHLGTRPSLVDFNHDGRMEVLCANNIYDYQNNAFQGRLRVLNGETGEKILTRDGLAKHSYFPNDVTICDDLDGDGWSDIRIVGNAEIVRLSGEGNFHEFMHSSGSEISASNGGAIDLELDFTEFAQWYEYRVLLSAHGPGKNFQFGIRMPLTLDHWVFVSMAGKLPPGKFQDFHGVLDWRGTATAPLRFAPNEIPSTLIGNTATFSALARPPWGDWKYCSIPHSVTIVL